MALCYGLLSYFLAEKVPTLPTLQSISLAAQKEALQLSPDTASGASAASPSLPALVNGSEPNGAASEGLPSPATPLDSEGQPSSEEQQALEGQKVPEPSGAQEPALPEALAAEVKFLKVMTALEKSTSQFFESLATAAVPDVTFVLAHSDQASSSPAHPLLWVCNPCALCLGPAGPRAVSFIL